MSSSGLAMASSRAGGREADLLRLMNDARTRVIVDSLARGPQRACRLEELRGLARSTLYRRLGELTELGVVSSHRVTQFPLRIEYSLTATGRVTLAHELLIERERHRRMGATSQAGTPTSLDDLVQLLAPLTHMRRGAHGVCRVEELVTDGLDRAGNILAGDTLVHAPDTIAPDARIAGTPSAWDNALLLADSRRLTIAGDRRLGRAVLSALEAPLRT